MEELIKIEYSTMCHGCFSVDRRLSLLGQNSEMYWNLIGNQMIFCSYNPEDIKLCWECMEKLRKFKAFQMQLRASQQVLTQYYSGLETTLTPITNLKTCTKTFYDSEIKHRQTIKHVRKTTKIEDVSKKCKVKLERIVLDEKNIEFVPEKPKNNINAHTNDEKVASKVENGCKVKNEADMQDCTADDGIQDNDDHFSDSDNKTLNYKQKSKIQPPKTEIKVAQYANHVKVVKSIDINFDNIESYYTTLHLGESEMEKVLDRGRRWKDHKNFAYSCTTCDIGYNGIFDLQRHNDLNHPTHQFKCSHCKKILHTQAAMERHWRQHSVMAKCTLCEKVMNVRCVKKHLQAHRRMFACKYCRETFVTITSFAMHYRNNHMTYTCDYCKQDFQTKTRLEYHISQRHIEAFCSECNRTFPCQFRYSVHCNMMHPHLTKRKKTVQKEECFCVECDRQFNTPTQYKLHLKTSLKHAMVRRYTPTPCPECGKMFARKLNMKYHYDLYHLKNTPFYCQLCDKHFARPSGLQVHNNFVHKKVQRAKDKICDFCGRAFSTNRMMMNHRLRHTGERPHACLYCPARFIQKYAMQTHMRKQHKHAFDEKTT